MDFHLIRHRHLSKRGQLTLIDLALAPIVAILLSVLAVYFLNSAISANLVTAVDQAPIAEGCNFALTTLYGSYYVHTASALNTLKLYYQSQYLASETSKAQTLSASCGSSCALSSTFSQNSLSNSTSLYSDLINYYSSFSFSVFDGISAANSALLSDSSMKVYLNTLPPAASGSTVCSLPVYNPEDPANPYTVFGLVS
jgi:hypothetical protein